MNMLSSRLLLLLVTVLVGCSPAGNDQANGGIGGSGTTTGYGSLYINEHRHYQIAEDALVWLDGELLSPTTINPTGQGLPLGLVAEFVLDEDANAEMTTGTIGKLVTNHRIIGPVTGLSPLTVLGQPVRTSPETLLDNVVLADLEVGQDLKVAGLKDSTDRVRASRVAAVLSPPFWQLVGRIKAVDASGFSIGSQRIELRSTPAISCDGPLTDDRQVLLRAQPQTGFIAGNALTGVTDIICLADGLSLFGDEAPATLPATADGFITSLELGTDNIPLLVSLDGQQVDLSNVLPVLTVTLASLESGSRLEVDGVLDTTTGILHARRLRLRDDTSLIEIIAPLQRLENGDVIMLGQTLTGLPVGESGSVLDALTDGDSARLLGFVSDGTIYAVKADLVARQNSYAARDDQRH